MRAAREGQRLRATRIAAYASLAVAAGATTTVIGCAAPTAIGVRDGATQGLVAERGPGEATDEAATGHVAAVESVPDAEAPSPADAPEAAMELVAAEAELPEEVAASRRAPTHKVAAPPTPGPPPVVEPRGAGRMATAAKSAGPAARGDRARPSKAASTGGEAALGSDPESAFGTLMGGSVGESYGYGGLGLRGTGRGGGGSGSGTIGLGSMGTIGRGAGGGSGAGYGRGAGGAALRGRRGAAGKAAPSSPRAAASSRGGATDAHGHDPSRPVAALTGAEMLPIARRLTAAVVADHDAREGYLSFLERHPWGRATLRLDMTRRMRLRAVDQTGRPLHDVAITVVGQGLMVHGKTHADGRWDFFPGVSAPHAAGPVAVYLQRPGGETAMVGLNVPAGGDTRDVVIRMPGPAAATPRALDLGFLIDSTGSMGDELEYVTAEVAGIVARVRAATPGVRLRVGATLYRDRGDMRPLQRIPFTEDVDLFRRTLEYVNAEGGGDYPEDLNAGLAAAIHTLEWSRDAAARVLVVIADAPPQEYADAQYDYSAAMRDAGAWGIRLLPVATSGADRTVEYLFRAMGTFTSSPYIYLTDDSGIGNPHLEADTDAIQVEMFSDALTRLLIADLRGEGMHAPSRAAPGLLVPVPGQ